MPYDETTFIRPQHMMSAIVKAVASVTGIPVAQIVGRQRGRSMTDIRTAAMLIGRDCGWSFPQIGKAIGQRDHTSVMHNCRVTDELVARKDPRGAYRLEIKAKAEALLAMDPKALSPFVSKPRGEPPRKPRKVLLPNDERGYRVRFCGDDGIINNVGEIILDP